MGTKTMQLCWDCKNACCGCSWSLAGEPIPGWTAKPTINKDGMKSYLVTDCPEFVRDAYNGGTSRNPPLTDEEKARQKEERRIRYNERSRAKYRRIKAGESA